MITINLQNVEELIFQNDELFNLFPEFKPYKDQLFLTKFVPNSKLNSKKIKLNLLNNIRDRHIKILQDFFQKPVHIEGINLNSVVNIESNIEDLDKDVKCTNLSYSQYVLYRDSTDKIGITFLR